MSTAVEEATKEQTTYDTGIPEWAAGYGLTLPCDKRTPPCDQEAEWFASQHGCRRAHLCNDHMIDCYQEVNQIIGWMGSVRCTECGNNFETFEAFIKCVRI